MPTISAPLGPVVLAVMIALHELVGQEPAVTNPDELTAATLELLDDHVTWFVII